MLFIRTLTWKDEFVGNVAKLFIVLFFAFTLFYAVTSSSLLQRISYDIYECEHQEQGNIKVWFKDLAVGQSFEFTRNGVSNSIKILEITDDRVMFKDGEVAMELDMPSKRLLQDDQSLVTLFFCKLNKLTM